MTHGPGCSKPPPSRNLITPGWIRLKCPECRHVENVSEAAQDDANPLTPATGYRCRDHHDQPVTWRGKGCTRCDTDRKRRKAPQPRDDYEEMETYR